MAYDGTPTTHTSSYLHVPETAVEGDALSTVGVSTAWIAANAATNGFIIVGLDGDLDQLTKAEALLTADKWHEIVMSFVEHFYQAYNAISTANKPDTLTITRSALVDTATAGQSKRTWSFTATLDTSLLDVTDPTGWVAS